MTCSPYSPEKSDRTSGPLVRQNQRTMIDFEVVDVPGVENVLVDSLSRANYTTTMRPIFSESAAFIVK